MNVMNKIDVIRKWIQVMGSVAAILIIPMVNVMLENTEFHVKEAISQKYVSKEMFDSEKRRLELAISANSEKFEKLLSRLDSLGIKLDAAILNQATQQQQMRSMERSLESLQDAVK